MHIEDQDHRDEHADDTSKMQSRKRLAPTFSNDLESREGQGVGGGGGIGKGDASLADSLEQVVRIIKQEQVQQQQQQQQQDAAKDQAAR